LDILTILTLAHHKSIKTTRKHYAFFGTQKALGQMDGAVEGWRAHLFPIPSEEITALSLH
jgi:hypothetical protein